MQYENLSNEELFSEWIKNHASHGFIKEDLKNMKDEHKPDYFIEKKNALKDLQKEIRDIQKQLDLELAKDPDYIQMHNELDEASNNMNLIYYELGRRAKEKQIESNVEVKAKTGEKVKFQAEDKIAIFINGKEKKIVPVQQKLF